MTYRDIENAIYAEIDNFVADNNYTDENLSEFIKWYESDVYDTERENILTEALIKKRVDKPKKAK